MQDANVSLSGEARRGPDERATTEARLALSIAAGRMAIWDYDLAADNITGSPELFGLLGFPPGAEPTTDEIRARYYPGERERLQAEGRAAMARGERFVESEFRYLWPDGSIHWVLLRAQALPDSSGRPVRALGVVMDITERKRAEDALRVSETRLKLAQDAAGLGIWDWSLREKTAVWSPEIYALLGLDSVLDGPPRTRTWLRAIHHDDRRATAETIRRAVADGRAFSVDFRLQRPPAAAVRWIRSRGAPVLGEDGRPSRFVGVNLDVTDEHRREERLLVLADDLREAVTQAERERERISELSNDLFVVVDANGTVAAFNPAWSRLLAHEGLNVRGLRFLDLLDPDDRSAASEALAGALADQALHRFEARLGTADGARIWVAWAVAAEAGNAYAVGRDITPDKAREAASAQTQKMEALGQLTGGIAHDFNNLLQAVTGYVELIRLKPGDPTRVGHWADNALLASERGAKLTGQLLAFSRAQRIEVVPVSVGAVLDDLGDLLERTLGAPVRIQVDRPDEPLGAMADRAQLETALVNLGVNARDAMPNGGSLTITARPVVLAGDAQLQPGDYIEIDVRDTGTGMPPEVLSRAFDPFFTTKGVGKGTGLGLSQVYGMARHAGGTARIESRPGEGTTVSLLLRRASTPVDRGSDDDGLSGPEAEERAAVLVVDDDPDVRSLLADMLAALGYAASFAADGPSALAALDRAIPDVVLMDFAMPGMNGAEVARAALERHPGLRIVFASGHADTDQIDAALGPSAIQLRKPFRMGDLAALLTRVLADGGPLA